jgi:hypothetical protein
MNTGTISTAQADLDAVIASIVARQPIDPELLKRVREESERIRDELRKKGPTNIAVELIREGRDE